MIGGELLAETETYSNLLHRIVIALLLIGRKEA